MPTATARPTLAAEPREITGKAVKRLRQGGRLPGVVYGHGVGSTNVSVDTHEFDQLRRQVSSNTLVDLSVDGEKPQPVLVLNVQIHPVNRRPLHVDLFLVTMTQELTVDVPLVALGEAPAAALGGGTLLHPIEMIRVRALPDHLPQSIEYDVSSLTDFELAVRVHDLTIPEDVTLLTDGDEIVARVQAPRVIEVEEVPVAAEGEGEEGEPGAEGEGGEAAPSDGGTGDDTDSN